MGTHQDLMNARWRKSSYSGNTGGECVEVADLPSFIAVRDSKNPEAAHFAVAPQAWAAFVGAFK